MKNQDAKSMMTGNQNPNTPMTRTLVVIEAIWAPKSTPTLKMNKTSPI
jgi:hypothetical protein